MMRWVLRARVTPSARVVEALAQHHHVRCGLGDFGAFAHGDRNLCCSQHRRIVDAVADHSDYSSLGLQSLDIGQLVLGQGVGLPGSDTELTGGGGDRRVTVA
jgi:hypothetical protein